MDQFTAHLDRGWELVARGDLPGALLSARKGIELDMESPEAHNLLGYVQAAEGEADAALDSYRQAMALDDCFVEAMLNAAEVMMHPLRDMGGALQMVEEALDLLDDAEDRVDATLLKIDILLMQGNHEDAARIARALPDGPFENPGLWFLIGRALVEVGEVERAEPALLEAEAREPLNPETHYYLGLVREARGDHRNAIMGFLRSRELELRIDPPLWSLRVEDFERRVQEALQRLGKDQRETLDGALVIVGDVPGAEAVADGVDPRLGVLVDDVSTEGDLLRVGRVFVYQRNVERTAASPFEVEDTIVEALEQEMSTLSGVAPCTTATGSVLPGGADSDAPQDGAPVGEPSSS